MLLGSLVRLHANAAAAVKRSSSKLFVPLVSSHGFWCLYCNMENRLLAVSCPDARDLQLGSPSGDGLVLNMCISTKPDLQPHNEPYKFKSGFMSKLRK